MSYLINLYETFSEALHAVGELEAAKVSPDDISLIVLNGKDDGAEPCEPSCSDHGIRCKSFTHMQLHHLAGMAPVAGCGFLVSSAIERTPAADLDAKGNGLSSAPTTGLAACLVEYGLSKEYADTYIEGVKRGSTLLGVRVAEGKEKGAIQIMRNDHRPLDPRMRGKHYSSRRLDESEIQKTRGSERVSAMLIGGLKKN